MEGREAASRTDIKRTMSVAQITTDGTRTKQQELWHAISHGLGALLAVIGAYFLIQRAWQHSLGAAIACAVYCGTLVSLYTISALSHAVHEPRAKYRLQILDQGVIYLLIAGTYTPIIWGVTSGAFRFALLTALWISAALGLYSKLIRQHRVTVFFSPISYLLMGWLPAAAIAQQVSSSLLLWMFIGGVCYTVGTVFLMRDERNRFYHLIWHVWVILGSLSHFYAIYVHVL